ncbi:MULTISPECIES: hypothetical protein [Streptomyces]|uniref:Tn3 transposase DDE domain-containing protein n=1 Tax=Streptomyces canarius TaxID=285453 RepID=A0ABQ3D9W1_9ACTN|nr:hypothetical protein [Streptomyces canarius]GHA69980.1 hypothetical protein GCM10010345_86760 [Streptomyces canarius]
MAAGRGDLAIHDRRTHSGPRTLGITLSHALGRNSRYSRYIEAIEQHLADAPAQIRNWTARDMDTTLYWLNHPTNTTTNT